MPRFEAVLADTGRAIARSRSFKIDANTSSSREAVRSALADLVGELASTGWHVSRRGRAPWDLVLERDGSGAGNRATSHPAPVQADEPENREGDERRGV